ncbi:hypothetical protein QUO07_004496 [Vibrio parahaemolyticus]|nr:hypothetical protein [Vibrio parahaemolyticus]EII3298109.1 hypothetical protein [Vibrio parahaemolyticus]EIZ1345095.1 hypothetical protein [Vibrio parahaemolyticus]ELA9307228.1 hypothetical protein [Vibrio parahaemolyticus]ELI5447071.1 hypothetical protein [Vibrio parahaemolyticus]
MMPLNEIGALGSAIGGVCGFLSLARDLVSDSNEPASKNEDRKAAIHLVLEAARMTRVYLYDCETLNQNDRIRENDLSSAWLKASEAIHNVDPNLYQITQVKAFGWAEPNRWQELKKNVSTIKIDDIIEQCNHVLAERT